VIGTLIDTLKLANEWHLLAVINQQAASKQAYLTSNEPITIQS